METKSKTIYGYIVVVDREFSNRANGQVFEHRVVMGKMLGRKLRKDETVHHINGDRADNRPENLQLRQGKHGNGSVAVCLDCGSHNISFAPIAKEGPGG